MAGTVSVVSSSVAAPGYVSASAVTAQETPVSAAASAASVRNPQIIQDPMAGYITQYVNVASGQVLSQAPSARAVAYLRQGLTASGMPKQTNESVTTTA
ncbi:MAG: hypothetical protein WC464_08800 [Bdellovibrionales bacterium]